MLKFPLMSTPERNQIPLVNQEMSTNSLRGNQITRTPYEHPNDKSKHLNQFGNLYHSERNQVTYIRKNIDVTIIESCDNNSSRVSSNCKIPQKIDLGWPDLFSVREFY